MANLTENTQYGSNGGQSNIANLSNIMKGMQQKSQDSSSDTVKSAVGSYFNPSSIFQSGKKVAPQPENNGAFPLGQPIGKQVEGARTEPIPGYEQFKTTDPSGKWVAPTEAATLRNWPTSLGGGQYVTDPTQPGKMIKSDRVLWDENLNPGGKKAVLGKKDSRFYQVDHIVPLWIGGADTAANSEILDVTTHERKTAIQAVPLTLLANGKIDLNQAKLMALTWKDKDPKGLPSADDNGYVPLDVAEKFKQKWENDISHPSMWKYFGESFKENMANFGEGWLPDPIREFGKGLVGGGTAGIVPGTGASEDSGTLGAVANMAGNIVGTITGLGLVTKGVVKALGGAKAVLGIKNAVTIADDASKAAGLMTDVGKISKTASLARVEKLSKMAKSAGLLSLWGQIGVTGREITGQEQAEFKTHVKQFMTDVAFGSLLGAAGQTMKGYATVGLGSASLSLMEGSDIPTAIQDGALMTALHGLGYKKGMVDPKTRIGNEEAYKMAATTFNQYVGPEFNTIKRGQPVPTILKFESPKIEKIKSDYKAAHPNDTRFDDVSDTGGAVKILGRTAKTNFLETVKKSNGSISQDQISNEMKRITVAENQLYNQTLELNARQTKEWNDLLSMGEKLRPQTKSNQFPEAKNHNEILNKIPEVPKSVTPAEAGKYPTGKSGITGYGGNLDAEAKANVNDFAKNPSNYDGKIYIPKTDKETASIMRLLEQEQISSGQSIGNPDKTLRAFVKTIEGEFKPIGYVPQEKSFDIKRDNLNKTYQLITTRLQQIRKSAKTPESMMNMYNADKAGIQMDIKTAENLFARKGEKISDVELYEILKPSNAYSKLDSNLNNEALSDQMDKLGLNYLVVDPYKAWEINGQRPRWNPENPYASIEITPENWAQSIEMNKTSKLTPVESAIKKVGEQIKADALAKANGVVTPQQELPISKPKDVLKTALESRKRLVEAPLVEETTITPKTTEVPPKMSPKEKYKNIQTAVVKTPEVKNVSRIENLVERGKLTKEEAKPYLEKEKRLNELNEAMSNRVLDYSEKSELVKVTNDLNNLLETKGLVKKPIPVKQGYSNYKKIKEKNINSLLDDAIISAEGSIDMIKGQKATSSPDTFKQAVNGSIQGARSLITNNKLGLTSAEQRELTAEFNKRIDRLVQMKSDQSFEGSPNLSGQKYDSTTREFLGWDPVRGVEVTAKGKRGELSPVEEKWLKENENFDDKTIKKVKDSLLKKEQIASENADQKLARMYDLELKDDGYLKLNKKGEPLFKSSEKTDPEGKRSGKTPLQFYGSILSKDIEINNKIKTLQSEKLVEGFNIMSKAPNTYSTFGDVVNKLLKKVVVDPQEKWLQDRMGGNPGKSFTFNSLMNSRSNYMKRLFETTNTSGHTMSQPIERIIAKVEGASPEKISEIDRNTIKREQESALARAERGSGGNQESVSSLSKDNILSEGIATEDLKGLSVKDTFQMEKLQDLTNFEMRFPSFLYEEITGKTPPKAAVVDDAISFIKDFLSNYNKNIKTGGKIKKAPYINKQGWEKIKSELLGEKKIDGAGGPYDGKGGFWGNIGDAIRKPFSNTVTYNRADYFPDEFKDTTSAPTAAPKPEKTTSFGFFNKKQQQPVITPNTYNVRGIKVSDADIKEASDILYGEISNRNPERQAAEVKYAINTAINRANANPKKYGGSIINVLKEPAQYQSYAPQGIKKNGQVVESQYQKLKKGEIDESGKKKLETIISALSEMKSGSFPDTTGGKTFYVHASDGTMWLGKTQKEAKDLANKHEIAIKSKPTNWKTVAGYPNGAERGF